MKLKIKHVMIYYENLKVIDEDGNDYFLSFHDLTEIFKRADCDFNVEKKRTRTWISIK
jgi:hypothetical protein